jgi:uracil-DNA glycosylase
MADHPVLQPLTTGQLDAGWRKLVIAEANKPYFGKLMSFLKQEQASKQTIFPPYPLVLNALTLCRWEDVRVVIIGQDPYHAPGQAHGLAFSVVPPTPPPPSLMNIYKEAAADVGIAKPTHGNLEAWCGQGVLLINTVLTVRRGQAHSHKGKGWEMFTDAVIHELNAKKTGLVFLLWGRPAQEKCKAISRGKHRLITCTHPSPLSAHNNKTDQSFIGSRCFSKANAALKELGKREINWNV